MARLLLYRAGMRILARYVLIVITLLLLAPPRANAQETTPPDGPRSSPPRSRASNSRGSVRACRQTSPSSPAAALDRQKLRELAARLEAEQPRYVAAVRVTPDPDGGARVVFVVARMRDPEHQADINAKYVVEEVEIGGVRDSDITAEMRADQQALMGKPLDSEAGRAARDAAEVGVHRLQRGAPDEPRKPARPDQSGLPARHGPNSRDGSASNRWRPTRSITPIRAGERSCR